MLSVAISDDSHYIVSGSFSGTVLVHDASNGIIVGKFLKRIAPVIYVSISGDNRRVTSIGRDFQGINIVYIWHVLTGKQITQASQGAECARLLWRSKSERSSRNEMRVDNSGRKPNVILHGHGAYIREVINREDYFKKVGHFDSEVKCWDFDVSGNLWVCLRDGTLAVSNVMEEEM